jgi:uncharacterized protein YndB with AHSA1/START domain
MPVTGVRNPSAGGAGPSGPDTGEPAGITSDMTSDGESPQRPRLVQISRTLPGSPARVWAALTDPDQLSAWFWPSGYGTTVTADVRVGGRYRIAARDPELAVSGEYLEVVPPWRLVATWRWDGEEAASVVRVDLLGNEHGSGLVLTHEGLAPDEVPAHEQGWSDCLDRLAGHLR